MSHSSGWATPTDGVGNKIWGAGVGAGSVCLPVLRQAVLLNGQDISGSPGATLGTPPLSGNLLLMAFGSVAPAGNAVPAAGLGAFAQVAPPDVANVDAGDFSDAVWWKQSDGTEGIHYWMDQVSAVNNYLYVAEFTNATAGQTCAPLALDTMSRISNQGNDGPITSAITPSAGMGLLVALLCAGGKNTPGVGTVSLDNTYPGWNQILGMGSTGDLGGGRQRQAAVFVYRAGVLTNTVYQVEGQLVPGFGQGAWSVVMGGLK